MSAFGLFGNAQLEVQAQEIVEARWRNAKLKLNSGQVTPQQEIMFKELLTEVVRDQLSNQIALRSIVRGVRLIWTVIAILPLRPSLFRRWTQRDNWAALMALPAFTDERVIAMRDLRRARNVSTETLAEHFGVNRRTVWRALVGDSYRHLNLDHPPVPDKVAAGRIVRGERNGASKLSDDEVLTIRRRLKQGESGVELRAASE